MLLPKYNFNTERKIGEHTILLPDPPDIKYILYRNLPESEQYFRRTYLPNNWDSLPKEDKNKFANEQWDIRGREGEKGKGLFFFNNGKLEWMSPNHYFYCNWWRIGKVKIPKEYISDPRDMYYPFFTDADRDWHYLADDCYYDRSTGGLFTIEFRRGGKTYRVACYQYEKVSKTHDAKGGIQSRDDNDSYNVFEKVIYGWRNLPPFFKPVDTGNNNPLTSLIFDEPKRISTKNLQKTYSDILHSWIDYGNASEGFYDGKEQIINVQDEIGKINSKRAINLLERIRVVIECCFIMGEKVGMVLGTTTIEEMEKAGGKQAKELWIRCTTIDSEASSLRNIFPTGKALDEFGFTQSKMKRYFRSSTYGYLGIDIDGECLVDRYGYSRIEKAREYFLKRRANKKGAELASEKRKFPLEISDCWVSDSKKSVFDTTRIEQQIEYNQTLPNNILVRGNFQWKDGIKDTIVEWHPTPEGKWLVAWLIKFEDRNKWNIVYGKKSPANTDMGCIAADPYDNKVTVDDRKSDAASYIYRKFDPLNPNETGIFVSEYLCRPKLPEIFWEDMILQSVFFGFEILIENNKIGTINYFRMRGYERYLMERPEETKNESGYGSKKEQEKGIAMSGEEARMALIYATESFIASKVGLIEEEGREPYYGKCYFDKLLNQWLDFDFDLKWTAFDAFVAAGLALIGSRKHIPKKVDNKPIQLFQRYRSNGMGYIPIKD